MARKKRKERPGLIDRILLNYYRRKLDASAAVSNDELEIISDKEASVIKKEMIYAVVMAALLGVLGVLFLYIPKYVFPQWFEYYIYFTIPYFDGEQEFAWVLMLYSIVLAQLEIYLLVYFNARAVSRIANANGFPVIKSPDFEKHMRSLIVVALEKKDKTIKKYGIDPYFGLSKLGMFLYLMIVRFKATLSNMFVKLVIGRIAGRAVLRVYIDMLGLLVYPAWNVFASLQVIWESRLRIMAPNLIRRTVDRLFNEFGHDGVFETNLFHCLSFLSQVKRNYNYNLYLLTDAVINTFRIEKSDQPHTVTSFIENLKTINFAERNGMMKLIIFGMLIDGKLTKREKKILQRLYDEGVSVIPSDVTLQWSRDYLRGKGMYGFMNQAVFAGNQLS